MNTIQIQADDGCVYIYNVDTGKAQKLCDLASPKEFPEDVKQKIAELQRKTVCAI